MTYPPRVNDGKKRRQSGLQTRGSIQSHAENDFNEDDGVPVQHSVREVKSKVSDFSRFVDSIAVENEATKTELLASKKRVTQLTDRVEGLLADMEELEQSREVLVHDMEKQKTVIQELRNANGNLQRRLDYSVNQETQLVHFRAIVDAVKSQIQDYITLESSGSPLITTTGQVRVLLHFGPVGLSDPVFLGDEHRRCRQSLGQFIHLRRGSILSIHLSPHQEACVDSQRPR